MMEKLGIGYPFAKQVELQKQTILESTTQKTADENRDSEIGGPIPEVDEKTTAGTKTAAGAAENINQPENSSITITVPGMNLEREGTQTESMVDTSRTLQPTPFPSALID